MNTLPACASDSLATYWRYTNLIWVTEWWKSCVSYFDDDDNTVNRCSSALWSVLLQLARRLPICRMSAPQEEQHTWSGTSSIGYRYFRHFQLGTEAAAIVWCWLGKFVLQHNVGQTNMKHRMNITDKSESIIF